MREIKFRAWDKFAPTPQMVFFDLDILQEGKTLLADSVVNADVMQYTGLKDKNGREVYEGDVVRISSTWHDYGIGSVAWDKLEVRFCVSQGNNQYYIDGGSDELEVIGNIYENPELLKQ